MKKETLFANDYVIAEGTNIWNNRGVFIKLGYAIGKIKKMEDSYIILNLKDDKAFFDNLTKIAQYLGFIVRYTHGRMIFTYYELCDLDLQTYVKGYIPSLEQNLKAMEILKATGIHQ